MNILQFQTGDLCNTSLYMQNISTRMDDISLMLISYTHGQRVIVRERSIGQIIRYLENEEDYRYSYYNIKQKPLDFHYQVAAQQVIVPSPGVLYTRGSEISLSWTLENSKDITFGAMVYFANNAVSDIGFLSLYPPRPSSGSSDIPKKGL